MTRAPLLLGALLLASPAAAQAPPPRVVRAVWIGFEPGGAPRIRAAVEAPVPIGPVRPQAQSEALEAVTPQRVYPLAQAARLLSGDVAAADPSHPARGRLQPGFDLWFGFAPGGLEWRDLPAGLALEPLVGSPTRFEVQLRVWLDGMRFFTPGALIPPVCWTVTERGLEGEPAGFGSLLLIRQANPYVFVTVVPAADAARLPVDRLDTWRAHALAALRERGARFWQVGQEMGWSWRTAGNREEAIRGAGVFAAVGFFALVPGRGEEVRAALRALPEKLQGPAPQPSPIRTALALADDPAGNANAYNRGGVGPAHYAYLRRVALDATVPHLREQALNDLRTNFTRARLRGDPALRVALDLPRPGPPAWLVVYLVVGAIAVVGLVRRPRRSPLHAARSRLVWGGLFLWADPTYLGFDLLPDLLGYLALWVAGVRLREAQPEVYPRWTHAALAVGALLALAVAHTPAPLWLAAPAGVALTVYGVGLFWGLARYLDDSDKAWTAHAARLVAGLIVLSLPLELVLGAAGGIGEIDTNLPGPFAVAVYPGLLLVRVGLPLLAWAVLMGIRPELHAAAQERLAEEDIPALERERRERDTPEPGY